MHRLVPLPFSHTIQLFQPPVTQRIAPKTKATVRWPHSSLPCTFPATLSPVVYSGLLVPLLLFSHTIQLFQPPVTLRLAFSCLWAVCQAPAGTRHPPFTIPPHDCPPASGLPPPPPTQRSLSPLALALMYWGSLKPFARRWLSDTSTLLYPRKRIFAPETLCRRLSIGTLCRR